MFSMQSSNVLPSDHTSLRLLPSPRSSELTLPTGRQGVAARRLHEGCDGRFDPSPLRLAPGTPQLPQCGFSRAVIQVLEMSGVAPDRLKTYNCLDDEELRRDIKEYSYVCRASLALRRSGRPTVAFHRLSSAYLHAAIGPRSRRSTSTASSWAAATSCCSSTRMGPWRRSVARRCCTSPVTFACCR